MTTSDKPQETFEAFRKSFFYGSRTDLNFKFLKILSDEEAAEFLQTLFWKLGDAMDEGDYAPVVAHVIAGQDQAYNREGTWQYDTGPFTPLPKPLTELRLALVTSTGHFVEGDDPEPFGVKNMSQAEAVARAYDFVKSEPQLSVIPEDTPPAAFRVRHGGYDIRGAQRDPNAAFPLRSCDNWPWRSTSARLLLRRTPLSGCARS